MNLPKNFWHRPVITVRTSAEERGFCYTSPFAILLREGVKNVYYPDNTPIVAVQRKNSDFKVVNAFKKSLHDDRPS